MNLKENENEKIKNIMKLSANFNVGSILMFSSTEKNNLLKIAKTPKGPTFTFKINKYTNNRELQELLPRNKKIDTKNLESPLVIINGFHAGSESKKSKKDQESESEDPSKPQDPNGNGLGQSDRDLLNTMFNNLFPAINLSKSEPKKLKRCVLVDYDAKTESIDIRHYYIRYPFPLTIPIAKPTQASTKRSKNW
jgi:ribosome biogenesis protein SSF1/2